MKSLGITVIIPCYNEECVIKETYKRLKDVMTKSNFENYELLFINDGSIDKTYDILEWIACEDKAVKVINFSRNFGHQVAVTAGINNAAGDVAIIIDADLQDPPELIPDMIRKYLEEGHNVIYGVRRIRKGESFFKKFSAAIFYRIINALSEVNLPLDTGDFRLIDRKVIETFNQFNEKNKYVRGIISWIGFKQAPIYYDRDPRFDGETKYTLAKMLKLATNGLLYFTKKPLKLALNLGFISIIIGMLLIIGIFGVRILNPSQTVTGWASVLVTVIFFGGVQLFTVGVLGEYIGSIFDEVKKRPEYIIDKKVNFELEQIQNLKMKG